MPVPRLKVKVLTQTTCSGVLPESNSVLYIPQTLEESEQGQARRNIGITDEMYEFIETGGGGGTAEVNVDDVTIKKKTDSVTGKKVLTAVDSMLDSESAINVMGVNVGNLHDGDTITPGTKIWDVLRRMLTNVIDVHSVAPKISLSSTITDRKFEIGTTITQTLSTTYTDGKFVGDSGYEYSVNAGCTEGATTFYKDGVAIQSATNTTTFTSAGNVVFSAETEYGSSTVTPKKNDGSDSSVSISSGSATSSITYTASKKIFYGGNVERLEESDDIRELDSNWTSQTTIDIDYVGIGVLVVMPYDMGISSAITTNNESWTDLFSYYDVEMEYANGATETYKAAIIQPSTAMEVGVRIILS